MEIKDSKQKFPEGFIEEVEFTENNSFNSEDLTDELLNDCYAKEITQNSDLGHGEILNIAKLLIYYCKENLKDDIFINGYKQYKNNCEDLCRILKDLQNNIIEHDKIKVEDIRFRKNIKLWEDGIENAQDRIETFYEKHKISSDIHYMTIKDLGEKYSKTIANTLFELGYGEWVFRDFGSLNKLKENIINDVLENDEAIEELNINRLKLYECINVELPFSLEKNENLKTNNIENKEEDEEI